MSGDVVKQLQGAQALLIALVQKLGGVVTITAEEMEEVHHFKLYAAPAPDRPFGETLLTVLERREEE